MLIPHQLAIRKNITCAQMLSGASLDHRYLYASEDLITQSFGGEAVLHTTFLSLTEESRLTLYRSQLMQSNNRRIEDSVINVKLPVIQWRNPIA